MINGIIIYTIGTRPGGGAAPRQTGAEPCQQRPETETKTEKEPLHEGAWVGDWTKGDKIISISKKGQVKLMMDGEVVSEGPLEGKGTKRNAPLDGCGAAMVLKEFGGDLKVELSGPECPAGFDGKFASTFEP